MLFFSKACSRRNISDNVSNDSVLYWAIVKICDEALLDAWPVALSTLQRMWEGDPRGQDQIRDFEARLQTASRDSNRARAIGSAFDSFVQLAAAYEGQRLLEWAVDTLGDMHTADADAELDRIYAQLQDSLKQFPDDAPARQFAERIEGARSWRALYNRRKER